MQKESNNTEHSEVETFIKEEYPEKEKPAVPTSGWGDSEHDTIVHRNLKPHGSVPNYNSEWGCYRHEE